MLLPTLHRETVSGTTVIRLTEDQFREVKIDLTAERLFQLADELCPGHLYLDLAAVESISCTGLGKLVALHQRVTARGGRLTLTHVCPLVYKVFAVTRLTGLLDVRWGGDAKAA